VRQEKESCWLWKSGKGFFSIIFCRHELEYYAGFLQKIPFWDACLNRRWTMAHRPRLPVAKDDRILEGGLTRVDQLFSDFPEKRLNLTDNARSVLRKRYLKKDRNGRVVETPGQMFRRVARHVAGAEKNYGANDRQVEEIQEAFYNIMTEFRFLPNSTTLMNAGRPLGQLAACFVLPVGDSIEEIFSALKNAALIHKSGGGTGFDFSRLRPKNSRVVTSGGAASGPVSFMKIFNTASEQLKKGGTRQGANMAVLRVDHPDIMAFIHCKGQNRDLNHFNISVAVTDAYMKAAIENAYYDLIDPRDHIPVGKINAGKVYHALVRQAWRNGDPGIIFLDRVNRDNPTPDLGDIEAANPCGEQPLLPMEGCTLGSINLAEYVGGNGPDPAIDFKGLKDIVALSVRFLDNTIDVSRYPLPEIAAMVRGNRKIGLGVMGFADMLFKLHVPYNSDKAIDIAEDVMHAIQEATHESSRSLAKERGVFENYDQSIFKDRGVLRRNATTTTIAPTGTISLIAGCSSGIEPVFGMRFIRHVMENEELREINPYFKDVARKRGFYSRVLMDAIAETGSIQNLTEIPDDVREVFVTAHDVSAECHVRMQAAFQKYTDNAVSKTVNLPHDATVEDVRKVYGLAFELGCKGVTIYRDKSKENQVLTFIQRAGITGEKCQGCGQIAGVEDGCTICGFCGLKQCG
jgi:ribonucleoside-diphosphate reductase alpha chain